jgi:periplasmic protein TonB
MMKFRYLLLPVGFSLMLLLVVQNSNAVKIRKKVVEKKKVVEEDYCEPVFCKVEQLAYFKGGPDSLKSFIANHTNYPDSAVEANIEGVVQCQFIISKTGKVTEAAIIRGLGYGLDEEVLRVINSMPDWKPGEQNGFCVSYRLVQNITFQLPEVELKKKECDTDEVVYL